jgi:hypothetical protein
MRAGLKLGGSETLDRVKRPCVKRATQQFSLAAWINESITARLIVHSTPKN